MYLQFRQGRGESDSGDVTLIRGNMTLSDVEQRSAYPVQLGCEYFRVLPHGIDVAKKQRNAQTR